METHIVSLQSQRQNPNPRLKNFLGFLPLPGLAPTLRRPRLTDRTLPVGTPPMRPMRRLQGLRLLAASCGEVPMPSNSKRTVMLQAIAEFAREARLAVPDEPFARERHYAALYLQPSAAAAVLAGPDRAGAGRAFRADGRCVRQGN